MGLPYCGDGGYAANRDHSPDRDDSVDHDASRRIVKRSAAAMRSVVVTVAIGRDWM